MSVNGELAAIDLGSNSFHMIVARVADDGQLVVHDRIREQVQLRAGLTSRGRLTGPARERAFECLERFGQRLQDIAPTHVRAVGTNTLRSARNARGFLANAEASLGHEIDVISGDEEARLIYLGVSHSVAGADGRRLVVDIGGGSTECIVGEKFTPRRVQSLEMGCVSYSSAHFRQGITKRGFEEATLAALMELRRHSKAFRRAGWDEAIGSSGTIKAIGAVLRELGSLKGITARGLKTLRELMIDAGDPDKLDFEGLSEERRPIFAGGVAILSAVFESLRIRRMSVSDGALREGLLYDLMGRLQHEDVRDLTVRSFESRYQVDTEQADRVERTALTMYDQVAAKWGLDELELRQTLAWAARLHEIGLDVSYERHHRHAGYLVANSNLPGFSREGQRMLAAIIESHRRRPRQSVLARLPGRQRKAAVRLTTLLRLAVRLHRSRTSETPPEHRVKARNGNLEVRFPPGWLEAHPLTRKDFEREAVQLERIGVTLDTTDLPRPVAASTKAD
ncbi:MAG: Ppx/GppA phosphatase family protein [Planctomycetota bacterium]